MSPFAYLVPLAVWVGLLVVSILCVYIAWRALFGDRGGKRRRCPKCWYDMAYSPGMTCPECGHVAQREADFQRTRRRPGLAALAIFICVALVLAVNDQMNERGLIRRLPSSVLIWILPVAGGMDGSIGREIDRRASSQQLTTAQWVTLLERCAAGGWTSRPPSDGWIRDYGEFIETWRNRLLNDATLEAPLKGIPPRFDVTTRDLWPEGAAPVVAVRLEDWWPAGMECRVRATPRVQGAEPITFYRSGEVRFRPSPFPLYLPPLPAGAHAIVIDFQVDRRRMPSLLPATAPASSAAADQGESDRDAAAAVDDDDSPDAAVDANDEGWENVGTYSVTLGTRIEGKIESIMQPASSAALDVLMAQAFGPAVRWTGGGRSPVRFSINTQATFAHEFNDTAVGVSVQLERDGVVARRLNLWWLAGTALTDERRNYGFEINYEDLELLRELDADDGNWVLRVSGDPLLALRAGSAKNFWQGEFTTPVNLRVNQTQAPPRLWWVEGEDVEPFAEESLPH
jgi:hypothetical protein